MHIFEKYPPSLIVFLAVGLIVTLAINPACGGSLVAVWWVGYQLDTF